MEMGRGGFDPYGISDIASDTSSDDDAYAQIEGLNTNLLEDLGRQKLAAREASKKRKGKREPNEPKARNKRPKVKSKLLVNEEGEEEEEPLSRSYPNKQQGIRKNTRFEDDNKPSEISEKTYLQWTTSNMRRRQEELDTLDQQVNQKPQAPQPSVMNAIGRHQREIAKLLQMPHLRDKQGAATATTFGRYRRRN